MYARAFAPSHADAPAQSGVRASRPFTAQEASTVWTRGGTMEFYEAASDFVESTSLFNG